MHDNKESPPPTASNDHEHIHRRADDSDRRQRAHARWYDSTKIQVTIASTLIGLILGAVAGGYALRDFTRTVEGTEERWARENVINEQKWQAINANTAAIRRLEAERDLILSVLSEIRCTLQADGTNARRRCADEEAERRLNALRGSRNP